MKHYYKRLDLTKLEYEYLIKCIDFEKLEEIEKRIEKDNENFETVKSFNIMSHLQIPANNQ